MMGIIFAINAQETNVLTSKNGLPVLPEKGDFSFGINAASLLSLFKDNFDKPAFDFIGDNELMCKYFLSDKSALFSIFRIGTLKTKEGDEEFEDYVKSNETNITLVGGCEKRLGNGRVQGSCGFGGGIILSSETRKDNADNTSIDEGTFGFIMGAVMGAEYFIAPKLSFGGQFRWGITYLTFTDKQNDHKSNVFILDLDNMNGAIMMNFYF